MSDRLDERIHQLKVVEAGIKRPKPETVPDSDINRALAVMKDDPGAILEPHMLQMLQVMRTDSPPEFARIRQRVKLAKSISMQEFDKLTTAAQEQKADQKELFPDVEPWPNTVNGAELLDDVTRMLRRFVIADTTTLRAAALWVAHTWLLDQLRVSPLAHVCAPEKRCGKSVLLTAMGRLVYRPLQTSNISTSALFRAMELWSPTILIDEQECFLRENIEAKGIINSGITRDSAFVVRCVGDDHTPRKFDTWGGKVLCGIGQIDDTLADRSIPLRLRRKRPGESSERIGANTGQWENLRRKFARWSNDNRERVILIEPEQLPGLHDRALDCWEPLMQVATAAGGEWPNHARAAACALSGIEDDTQSIGVELLQDIRDIFTTRRVHRIFSAELINELVSDSEAPWATWYQGKPMTPRQLAKRLREFGISSKSIRIGLENQKGYELDQFKDAFSRYIPPCSPIPPDSSVTSSQPTAGAGLGANSIRHTTPSVTDEKTLKATAGAGCDDVTDKKGVKGESKDEEAF